MSDRVKLSELVRLNKLLGPDIASGRKVVRSAVKTAVELQVLLTLRELGDIVGGKEIDIERLIANREDLEDRDPRSEFLDMVREEMQKVYSRWKGTPIEKVLIH